MTRWLPLILVGALLSCRPAVAAEAGSFETFVQDYTAADPGQRAAIADKFIADQSKRGGFPIIAKDGEVIFLYRADNAAGRVGVRGGFTQKTFYKVPWSDTGEAAQPIAPGAPIFVYRRRFETDARLDYQFVVDGKPRIDPLNPRHRDSGIYGEVSELVMPGYKEPEILAELQAAPQGHYVTINEPWAMLAVRVYLPPGYDPAQRYPVLYTPDGAAWSAYLRLPQIMDALIADGRIRPAIAVMIDAPKDRDRFYYFASDYLDYLDKVVAYVDAHFSTLRDPANRIHLGTSAGGRAAMYAALERPEVIGRFAMISPGLSGPPQILEKVFNGKLKPNEHARIWISAGSYEGTIYGDAHTMERVFLGEDLAVKSRYTHEGHSLAAWRDLLPEVLEYFLAPQGR